MRQRLSRDDFGRTSELMGGPSGRMWKVCEEYELKWLTNTSRGDSGQYFVVPKYNNAPPYFDRWRSYEPLEDTPDLFLKFARLHRASDQDEAMLAWVRSYGALGHGKPQWVPGAPQEAKDFWYAVGQAAGVLALYEAVLNGDDEQARSVILEEFPYVGLWWQIYNELPNRPASLDRATVAAHISDTVEEVYGGDYLWHALETAAIEVQRMVAGLCHPALTVEEGARDVSGVTAGWNFKSLLGAMYLQMHWLMAAGSDLTRCEHCGLLISLARTRPEGRKRRQDKRFCDDACRQAHHRARKVQDESRSKRRTSMSSKENREFVLVAGDCPVERGTIPKSKRGSKTVPMHTYEVLSQHPYEYTEDDLQHEVHVVRRGVQNFDPQTRDLKRNELPKRWGWGIHYNEDRKVALVGCETKEYERLARRAQDRDTAVQALRNAK